MRAADFSSSIGVGTHSNYYDTAYGYNNGQNILPDLNYLGVTQIRDGLGVIAHGGLIEQLMAAGIKDDMVAGNLADGAPGQTIAAYIANLEQFEADDPGGVNSVEGFNEVSAANLPAAQRFQAQLYAAIKADPKLAGISLYSYTGFSQEAGFYLTLGNVSSTTDYGSTHTYNEYFPPELWNSWYVPLQLGGMPNAPYVVTETGYDTSQLPADITAKQTLNDVLDLIHDGASKVYLYELLDEKPDPAMTDSQQHFGLFNIDNTPKPAAVALHNLNVILADPGAAAATFIPGTLAYSVTGLNSAPVDRAALQAAFGYGIFQSYITGMPAYGNSMLLAKSDGTFDLAVWQEPMIYDGVNRIASPVTSVTVTLGKVAGLVKVFDPLIGTAPIATYANVGQVTLQVTDHALIVEIDPAAPPAMAAVAPHGTGASQAFDVAPTMVHPNDLSYSSTASGTNHFINLLNFEASYRDLTAAFGMNQSAMQGWYNQREPVEARVETFNGLDYVASYPDLVAAFRGAGSLKAVQDDGAAHFITSGTNEGRTTTFNGLDYIASYRDLIKAFGASGDAGAMHFIASGSSEGRTTTFNGLNYIASYGDLIKAFGANEQAGANHFIVSGANEGRTTTFDGLDYIARYADLMTAFGANNDAGATHFIDAGSKEGRSASPFDVAAYETAHPDLAGHFATHDAFLTAYINTYTATGTLLT